jgi:hypothetical protein
MATKADFSEEEFETLQKGVSGAGMYVSLADRDFTDSFGEAKALAKFLGSQRSSDSALVRDVAAMHGSKFGLGTSPTELEQGTVEALRASLALLSEKAPDEVDAYKQLVTGVAQHVAEAKGGGESEAEKAAIAKINEALGGP